MPSKRGGYINQSPQPGKTSFLKYISTKGESCSWKISVFVVVRIFPIQIDNGVGQKQ
jgi:hypothetical protein